jgi:hypothetical protein
MPQYQGKKIVAVHVCLLLTACLVSQAIWADETLTDTHNSKFSLWKRTVQAMDQYSDLSFRLQENQRENELAISHFRILRENLQMQVSATVMQQIRGFRKYSGLTFNNKFDVKVNMIKSQPLTSKDTRILQNMTHFTTLEDSQGLSGKGIGVQFTYRLD